MMSKKLVFCPVLFSIVILASCSVKKTITYKEKYIPTWESLSQYEQAPEWFNNAKFGIWAHWGPQCEPEAGDWYARFMYNEGSYQYKYHLEKYGHPSEFGFKDIIHQWKADKWDPERLVSLYKEAGAEYFFAMGNHHDNFDLWDSKYQSWNSVNMGPKRDILGEWEKAARDNNLYFGVSIHSAHAWTWYETAQRSDKSGEKAGISYDGNMKKEDGTGTWWEGYDPQDLYAQNHPKSESSEKIEQIHKQWDWNNGASIPSEEYCENFMNRNLDMIKRYNPDIIYYDDTALPLWPISDVGLKIVSQYYNKSIQQNNGKNEVVVLGKILSDEQKKSMVWDVEKGAPDQIQDKPWQSCTCIGAWHYDRNIYNRNQYKSAQRVIHQLIDIVSKNGNMLLNIPIRGDGTIDEKEEVVLKDITEWMKVNKSAIHGTRPWKIFGEGPSTEKSNPINAQGFNEGKIKFSAQDIRFVTKDGTLYAHILGWPEENLVSIKSLAKNSYLHSNPIKSVKLLGTKQKITYEQNNQELLVKLPPNVRPNNISFVLEIN